MLAVRQAASQAVRQAASQVLKGFAEAVGADSMDQVICARMLALPSKTLSIIERVYDALKRFSLH